MNPTHRSGIVGHSVGAFITLDVGVTWAPIDGNQEVREAIQNVQDVANKDEGHGLAGMWAGVSDELEGGD